MTQPVTELQSKRAANLIWTAAGDYSFTPDFRAFDKDGAAVLYFNCILGAAHRHYDYPRLRQVFNAFDKYQEGEMFQSLLWLGLENCVYQREVVDRPALAPLRLQYAQTIVEEYSRIPLDDSRLYDCLALAHYTRALGREVRMNKYDIKLLDELEFGPELNTEQIAARAEELFARWFQITMEEARERRGSLFSRRRRQEGQLRFRAGKPGLSFLLNVPGSGNSLDDFQPDAQLRSRLSADELRTFMAEKYGKSLFSPPQIRELEKHLCIGNHKDCHLHFTKGEPVKGKIRNAFEAMRKAQEAAQMEENRQAYRKKLPQNNTAIHKLAAKIQNSILLYLHPTPVKTNAGRINGGIVWRAAELEDDRVFIREENGDMGGLCVDILLDASTSQKGRQETVAAQGYIIAQALTRCGIPCRVMSFCTMTGYTILRVFREYNEPRRNDKIFDYVANGCNRDGLAIRAARELIRSSPYEYRILIVLSDVKPYDIVRMPGPSGEAILYDHQAGVKDTAREVRLARAEGISVVCVFTGEDEDLPSAKQVYGRDFARIQSLDKLADTVGTLIQNQIRNI